VLYAFDLLKLDGVDLRAEPIEFRKAELDRLLAKRVSSGKGKSRPPQAIYMVKHLDFDDAGMVFDQACAIGCEGIVSKLKGSRYTSGERATGSKSRIRTHHGRNALRMKIGMTDAALGEPRPICRDARWVCQVTHHDRPWGIPDGCKCGAPGMPYDFCDPSGGPDDPPDMPPGFEVDQCR